MKRLNEENINTPENSSARFAGALGVSDIERFEQLAKYFTGGIYVDVGPFDSPMPIILSERFPDSEIHALDFAEDIVNFLKPRFPKVKYAVVDVRKGLPFADESVDYVVAGEVIEHMEEPQRFINELLRIVKKGGYLAISTPHKEIERVERIGGAFHLWSYDEQDMKDLLGNSVEIAMVLEGKFNTMLAWKRKE